MSKLGLIRGVGRAAEMGAQSIADKLKQDRLTAAQKDLSAQSFQQQKTLQDDSQAFQKELLQDKAKLGVGGAENDRRFARNLKILQEEGAVDERGQLKPEDQLSTRAKMAAIDAKLLAPAVGSGNITIARDPNLAQSVAGTQGQIDQSRALGSGRGRTTADLEAGIVPAYQGALYSMTQSAEAADTARELLEHPGFEAAFGLGGEALSRIPETDAAEAKALLDQLKNRTFVTALQAMRDASPTGGAVGQVSEAEGARFENAFASLSQAQGPEQARRELSNLIRIMETGQERVKDAFQLQYGNTQGFDQIFGRLPEVGARSARRSLKPIPPNVKAEAQAAINQGKPRDAIIQRLQELGYDPEGL